MRRTLSYYSLFFCLGLDVALLGPTIPDLAKQTSTSLAIIAYLFIAGSSGYLVGSSFAGQIFDHVKGHPILGLAQTVAGICLFCIPFAPHFWILLVLVLLKGIAQGMVNNGSNTLLVWTHGEKASPFMNGLHFFFGLGAFISPILTAQAINAGISYRWVYWVLAVFCILAGMRILVQADSPRHDRHTLHGSQSRWNFSTMWLIATSALFLFFYVGAELAFSGWIYTFAVQSDITTPAGAAYLNSGFWLFFTFGRLASIGLATRLTPEKMITISIFGAITAIGVLLVVPGVLPTLWLSTIFYGIFMAPIFPTGVTFVGKHIQFNARVSGALFLGDSMGGMVLPWLVGQIIEGAGSQVLIYVIFTSLFLVAATFVLMLHAAKKRIN